MRREMQVLQGRRREGKEGNAVLSMRLESDDCNHSFLCIDQKDDIRSFDLLLLLVVCLVTLTRRYEKRENRNRMCLVVGTCVW
jgi:hypothetical protein